MIALKSSLFSRIKQQFQDSSLNVKLVILITSITGSTVLLTLIFAMLLGVINMRKDLMESYQTTASMISSNLEAAVMFDDQYDSAEILSSLAIHKSIKQAQVFTAEGTLLAKYLSEGHVEVPLEAKQTNSTFSWLKFYINQPIFIDEKAIGSLHIYGVAEEYAQYLWMNLIFFLSTMIFAVFLVAMVSQHLGKIIISPIIHLSSTAKIIKEHKDYSIRQDKVSNDEVGHLIDSFNEMMNHIEEQNDIIHANALRFKSYFDLGIVGMALFNEKLELTEQNKRFLDILKYNEEDLDQLNWDTVLDKEASEMLQVLDELKNGQLQEYTGECWFKGKEGTVYALISIRSIPESKTEPKHFLMLVQDITDRKKHEEALVQAKEDAEASNKAKDDFLSVMSHELRTPLNPIIGFSDLIRIESDDPSVINKVSTIYDAANHLLDIITSILDYTKIEKGKMQLVHESFNYTQLCENAIQQLEQRNHKEISFEYSHQLTPNKEIDLSDIKISTDKTKLTQILYNLLENAYKFTEKGSIRLKTQLEIKSATQAQFSVTVDDTGQGIEKEKTKLIFEPFQQVDNSMSREHGGIGLGLAICLKIAKSLKGDINCRSTLGKGSQFTFSIPVELEIIHTQPKTKRLLQEEETLSDLNAYNILLVEDDPINQQLAISILTKLGYQVDLAKDGFEAIALAETNNYQLILMDLQLPKMDGFEATKKIREFNNRKKDTPIIAITAHASSVSEQECINIGMNDYISKPFTLQQLECKLALYHSN